jgi:hypothetical protein
VRGTRCRRDVPEAQPGADSRLTVLATQPLECLAGASPTSVGWSFSRSHPADHGERRLRADQPRAWSPRRTKGRTRAVHGAWWTRSDTPWSPRRTNGRTRPVRRASGPRSTAPWSASGTNRQSRPSGAARRIGSAAPWSGSRTATGWTARALRPEPRPGVSPRD